MKPRKGQGAKGGSTYVAQPTWGGPATGQGWGRQSTKDPYARRLAAPPPGYVEEQCEAVPDDVEQMPMPRDSDVIPPAYRATNTPRPERARILEDELFDIAMNPNEHTGIRILAADKALDRLKGKAVQRSILEDGLDDGRARIAEVRRIIVDSSSSE